MSTAEVTDDPVGLDRAQSPAPRTRARDSSRTPVILLAALYAAGVVVYTILSLRSPLPSLYPDEYRYVHLARAFADGTGTAWRGEPTAQTAALYSYVIAPAWWLLSSNVTAYDAAKVLGTFLLCAQIFPIWLVGREVVGPRLALVPAALTLAGTWMVMSAVTATEVLAMPLASGAMAATVIGMIRPSTRAAMVALVLALLATWARIQLVVLVPVIALAFGADVALSPRGARRERLRAHRLVIISASTITVLGALVAVAKHSAVGDYDVLFSVRPSLGLVADKIGLQALELAAVAGFAPVLFAAGAAVLPSTWRDVRLRSLVIVFWLASAALCLQSGFFLAGIIPTDTGIDRYVSYTVPLALVLLTALVRDGRLRSAWPYVAAAAGTVALLALPSTPRVAIERGVWSTGYRLHQLAGTSIPLGNAVLAGLVLVATLVVVHRLRRLSAVYAVGLICLAVLAMQTEAAWKQQLDVTRSFRSGAMPADLQWLDHHSDGRVAVLVASAIPSQLAIEEFFNTTLSQVYVPPAGVAGRAMPGLTCRWRVAADGTVVFPRALGSTSLPPACRPGSSTFLIADPFFTLTFYGQRVLAQDPKAGQLVHVPSSGPPRLMAIMVVPCNMHPSPNYSETSPVITPPVDRCGSTIRLSLWLHQPGRVVFTFKGGAAAHTVRIGDVDRVLPAGRTSTIDARVPNGMSSLVAQLDWASSGSGDPRLIKAELVQGNARTVLTY